MSQKAHIIEKYHKSGDIWRSIWFQNGKPHRIGGPAYTYYVNINYSKEPDTKKYEYWIDGLNYTEQEYQRRMILLDVVDNAKQDVEINL